MQWFIYPLVYSMNMEEKKVQIFGSNAESIQEGELFIAHLDSVEGRKRVTLVRK